MEKAFDLNDLVVKLKANGLPVVEATAKVVVEQVLGWVQESVVLSPNKYDDFALAILPMVKPFVMAEIDKIDGKVG